MVKQETKSFDIREMLEQIKEYGKVPEEEILDFIMQDRKDDIAFSYYKNMLLQLVEFGEHFELILDVYDRDLKLYEKRKILDSFCQGDTEEFKKVIAFAKEVSKLRDDYPKLAQLENLTRELGDLSTDKKRTKREIEQNEEEKNAKREEIEQLDIKVGNLRGIKNFFERRKLQKSRSKLEGQQEIMQNESETLEEEQEALEQQIQAKTQEIRDLFASMGMQELGEKYIKDFTYQGPDTTCYDYRFYSTKEIYTISTRCVFNDTSYELFR